MAKIKSTKTKEMFELLYKGIDNVNKHYSPEVLNNIKRFRKVYTKKFIKDGWAMEAKVCVHKKTWVSKGPRSVYFVASIVPLYVNDSFSHPTSDVPKTKQLSTKDL